MPLSTLRSSRVAALDMSTFYVRLAAMRLPLPQAQLGIKAGLEEESATARMNSDELGHRAPDFMFAEKLAEVVGVPTPWLYCSADRLAHLIEAYGRLKSPEKAKLLKAAQELT